MFKLNVGIGCGMVAAAFGRTGDPTSDIVRRGTLPTNRVSTDRTQALIQGMSVSLTAAGSTHKHREDSAKLLEQMEKLATGAEELPASIFSFVELILAHADDIKVKLVDEHDLQKIDLDGKFAAIGQCLTTLNEDLVPVDGDAATSKKSHAATAKTNLCTNRKAQAQATLDSRGCQQDLTCRLLHVQQTNQTQNSFNALPAYIVTGGASLCGTTVPHNTPAPAPALTAGQVEELEQWMDAQRTAAEAHWNAKKNDLTTRIDAYDVAVELKDALNFGTAAYAGRGCVDLTQASNLANGDAGTLSGSAILAQCSYYETKGNLCNQYSTCHDNKVTAWNDAKTSQTTSSQDRKDGWVIAEKIKCWASTMTQDAGNNAAGVAALRQLDEAAGRTSGQVGTAQAGCSAKTCDAACDLALDLKDELDRLAATKSPCTLPPQPCHGWDASCETEGWGTYTPKHGVDDGSTRTAPQCTVTPVAVNLGDGQVTQTCQACTGN